MNIQDKLKALGDSGCYIISLGNLRRLKLE